MGIQWRKVVCFLKINIEKRVYLNIKGSLMISDSSSLLSQWRTEYSVVCPEQEEMILSYCDFDCALLLLLCIVLPPVKGKPRYR